MKRILLASTALCLGAGMAVAMDKGATHNMSDGMGMSHGMGMSDGMMMEKPAVTLSGDGRMGVISDKEDNLKFSSRVRLLFSLAKELDNGLSAGGSFRAHEASGANVGKAGKIFLSGPFGTLTMGDVDPGAKAAVGNVDSVGYRNQGDPNEISYLRGKTGDEPALQYMLPKMGPVQVWASVGMAPVMENGEAVEGQDEISADTLSVGAKADLAIADMGTAWIGGGYEASTVETEDGHLVLGAGVAASGFSGTVVAGMQGRDGEDKDREQFAVSAGYSAGQIGVTVFYTDDSDFDADGEAFGAGFSWSLGGGAALKGGVTNFPEQEGKSDGDSQTADLGVTFSF